MEYLKKTLQKLIKITDELETKYSEFDRKFTLDGHLFGSIGEVFAAKKFDLKLEKSSQKDYDALDNNGNQIQIKVTQKNSVGIRSEPQNLLVLKLNRSTFDFDEIYYGNGKIPWEKSNKKNSSGQRIITLKKLKELNTTSL